MTYNFDSDNPSTRWLPLMEILSPAVGRSSSGLAFQDGLTPVGPRVLI